MAYLNKTQYEYRRESAAQRALENEDVAVSHGMTKEQAELISDLCALRHRLHTNIPHNIHDNTEDSKELCKMVLSMDNAGLPWLSLGDYWAGDYIDIDDMNVLYETETFPEDDTERDEWIDNQKGRIYDDWEKVNELIEKYLSDIDKQYKTHWCPTGYLRQFS